MKTKEELNALKEEVEKLNHKLAELTEDELKLVTGGRPLILQGRPKTESGIQCQTGFDNEGKQYEIHIYTEQETDFTPNWDK